MSAPLIWIIFPGISAVVLFFLRRWYRSTALAGTILVILLALLARVLPIGVIIELRPWSLKITDTLTILGRTFTLTDTDRSILISIYLLAAFWFAAAFSAKAGRMFVPLALAIVALLTAALAVEPFLYAALLIEMAALVCIPILSPPRARLGRGVLRFLIFLTFGMPFILISGWMLTGVEAAPGNLDLVLRASIFLAAGFALWLAIFPFHTWLPMLGEESHPFAAAFVFVTLSWMVILFGLGFLDRFPWLGGLPQSSDVIRLAGVIMVTAGGIWAAFQRHLGRMLGFTTMIQIGASLLAISLPGGLPLHFTMLLPRALGLGIWALALASIQTARAEGRADGLDFSSLRGIAFDLPFTASSLILAQLSLAGFPLLAGFPVQLGLWQGLSLASPPAVLFSLLGSLGLFIAAVRTLAVFITPRDQEATLFTENRAIILFLGFGILGMFLIGLFPQWFLTPLANLAQAYPQLQSLTP